MNKLYSVHDHWTDINKKNDVDIESIDGVIAGIKVNGEDFGGISWTQVFTGDVVASGEAAPFSGTIPAELSGADTIKVIYNNNVYILNKQTQGEIYYYGATIGETPSDIDFSVYPFVIVQVNDSTLSLYTQSPGPQDMTIFELQSGGGGESDLSTAEVAFIDYSLENPDFEAVRLPVTLPYVNISGNTINTSFTLTSFNDVMTVPLYKNSLTLKEPAMETLVITSTGDIAITTEGEIPNVNFVITISGDGALKLGTLK